jgi:hypothetical protein
VVLAKMGIEQFVELINREYLLGGCGEEIKQEF